MPAQVPINLMRLGSQPKQSKQKADNNSSKNCEDSNCTVLSVEEGHCAFKNGVGDLLHGRCASVFAQDISCEVSGKGYCKKSYDDGDKNKIVSIHDRKRPP